MEGKEGNQSKDNKKKSLTVLCENVQKLQSLMDQLDLTLSGSFIFLIGYNSKNIKTVAAGVLLPHNLPCISRNPVQVITASGSRNGCVWS